MASAAPWHDTPSASASAEMQLYAMSVDAIPANAAGVAALVWLWGREAIL